MKKILPVLIVLLIVVSCLTAVTVAAADPGTEGKGKYGYGAKLLDGGLALIEDFRPGHKAGVEGERLLPDELPEELGIIQLTR